MQRLLLVVTIIFFSIRLSFSQAPAWQWGKDANSTDPETGWDVAYDATSGNVYVGGGFKGNLSSVYGSSFSSSYGNQDGFLAKYDPSGNVIWAIKFGGINNDEAHGVSVDASGNIYVTGYFTGTADFDPTAATFALTSAGGTDGFLAKYSPSGSLLWAVKFGGSGDDDSWKMYNDANGVYITGSYQSPPATFYSYSSAVTRTTTITDPQINTYGAKYNSNGVVQWVISGGGNKDDIGFSVVADANAVYFIGRYDEDIYFRDASGTLSTLLQDEQNNKPQVYIIAITQTGAILWKTNITSSTGGDMVVGWGIAQDATNLYVTGYCDGNINFKYPTPTLTQNLSGGGATDLFLAKLSKTGTFLWNASVTGNGNGEQIGRALEVDANGNIILAGCYTNGMNYGAGNPNFTSKGGHDIFVTAYSNSGSFLWSTTAGGATRDYLNGMTVDNLGGVYVCGEQDGVMIIGTNTLTSGGGKNIFLGKLGCATPPSNVISSSQTICAGFAPATFTGNLISGSAIYTWQCSSNSTTWTSAPGTFTNQNYTASSITAITYYRRIGAEGSCSLSSLASNMLSVTTTSAPSTAVAGANQTVCALTATLNATTPAIGSGSWSIISGTSSVSSPTDPSSPITGLSVGTNSYVWTVSNGVCPPKTSTVSVIRNAQPTSNAGTGQTLCALSATMVATTPTIGTGIWTLLSGSGTITNASSPVSQITSLGTGTNNFIWTVSNGVCPPSASTVTIVRYSQPTASAGANQTVCSLAATLSATSPTIGSGSWSVITGTSNLMSAGSETSQVTGLNSGINTFVWTVTNGVCPAATSTVTITRDLPPVSNAGTSQTICSSTTTLSAVTPTTGSGAWSLSSGTGTLTGLTNPASQVTALGTGTNTFIWTVSNGVCPSATSAVSIIREEQPTSQAGSNQTVCSSSATLAAINPTVGNGVWSVITGTSNLTATGNETSQVMGLNSGINTFVWTVTNGVCPTATSTVSIIRDLPPVSNAGQDQTICTLNATLGAVNPSVGTGTWFLFSGFGTILSSSNPSAQVLAIGAGTNVFVWTVSNGICPVATSSVTIVKSALLTANAGVSQSVCSSNATLNAVPPSGGIGIWSVVTGTSSVNTNTNPASEISSLNIGLNTFLWTVSNGSCPLATSLVNVWRDAQPSSNAGSDQTICSSSATLSAVAPLIGVGLWSVFTGTASSLTLSNPLAILTGIGTGTNILIWTVVNGVCLPATSSVTVMRDESPVAISGNDQTLCSQEATLTATAPVVGTGVWSLVSGTGSISSPANPASQITSLASGTTVLAWTVSNGVCPASTSTVSIIRDEQPLSFAGTDQTVCATTITLAATIPTVGAGAWSLQSGSGNINAPSNFNSAITGLGTGTNSFVWTVINGVCPPATSTVTIIGEQFPGIANAGNDFTICSSSCTLSALTATPGTAGWSVYTGSSSITSTNNPASTVTNLSAGLNQFIWANSNGTCPPSLDTVSVYYTTPLPPAFAGTDQTLCVSEYTLVANNSGFGSWSILSGSGILNTTSNATANVSSLSTGANVFVWTVSKAFCSTTTDTVRVMKDENPGISNAGQDKRICGPDLILSASEPLRGKGEWKILQGSAVLSAVYSSTSSVTELSAGINKFVWTIGNGTCPSSSDTVIIQSDAIPSKAYAGKDLLVCKDDITLDAKVPVIGSGTWSLLSGTCSIEQSALNNTNISSLKEGKHLLKWTITNGVCEENSDTLEITRTFTPLNPDAGTDQVIETSTVELIATVPQSGLGTWSVITGNAEISDIHNKQTLITKLPFGNTILRWTIANESCPDVSDDILIHVKDLNIPNAFSPNGDGINDRFVITSLDYYKEVKISVFNRWGTLLYNNSEYKNNWEGVNSNNESLADDTYYYIIEIPELKNFTGFIVIKRDK